MYEHRSEPLLDRPRFLQRVARHGFVSFLLAGFSLLLGTAGYHFAAGLGWLDAFLNASMILTGMGPVNDLTTPAAKLFAACFALYSGVVFLVAATVLIAPILHRLLHRLHLKT